MLPRVLFLAIVLCLCVGCADHPPEYTRFHVTSYRGDTVAEWTARGPYLRTGEGYRITAVERISGPPYRQFLRYPDGRVATVTGPHIVHWPTSAPLWLEQLQATDGSEVRDGKLAIKPGS